MNWTFRVTLVAACAAAFVAGPARAGDHCPHAECGATCHSYVIDSYRHVPEVGYRDIRIKIREPRCRTELVEETSQVVIPSYQPTVETGHAVITVPRCRHTTYFETCRECRPETRLKPVTVDAG